MKNNIWQMPPVILLFLLLFLVAPLPVFAYIDPGTGSFFIQMIIASAVGLSVTVRMFWGRIGGFFSSKKRHTGGEEAVSPDVYDSDKTS